jgi:hypothetical protein
MPMRPARLGLAFQLPYLVYLLYCIARAVVTDDAGTQVAVAFWSFPTSMFAFTAAQAVLDWLGPYGDVSRRVGEWILLALAGSLQYFVLGYLIGKVLCSRRPPPI